MGINAPITKIQIAKSPDPVDGPRGGKQHKVANRHEEGGWQKANEETHGRSALSALDHYTSIFFCHRTGASLHLTIAGKPNRSAKAKVSKRIFIVRLFPYLTPATASAAH
jgi:hypothetical protein